MGIVVTGFRLFPRRAYAVHRMVPDWLAATIPLLTVYGFVQRVLIRGSQQPPALASSAEILLQHGPRGRALLTASAGLLVGLASILVYGAATGGLQPAWVIGLATLAALAVCFAWRSWRQRAMLVHADGIGITVCDHRARSEPLAWADLQDVRLSGVLLGCRLRGRGGHQVAFPSVLPGIGQLLAFVHRHVPAARWRRFRGRVQTFQEWQKMHARAR